MELLYNVSVSYPDDTYIRIKLLSLTQLEVKEKTGKVIIYDFQHASDNIAYNTSGGNGSNHFYFRRGTELYYSTDVRLSITLKGRGNHISQNMQEPIDFPVTLYAAEGEADVAEVSKETILFPPPETTEQFLERIYARLLHLTRRIKVLRHEEPHQNALSKNICREVPADHAEVLRYDIACNLIKRPVGWLALQLQTFQARYNRHLEAVVKAEKDGTTPPTFNPGSEPAKIEAMLDKLETHLTQECLQNHFDLHDHGEWDKIQNKQRKITLCEDDFSPGEVLVDVNSFFTDGDGNIAEEHAKRTYHEISTKYWVMAKRTPHRHLVRGRLVEVS